MFCSSIPADCNRKTNGPALPSIIGTSGPSRWTKRLSIPNPAIADKRCSTVETFTSLAIKVVDKVVSPTFSGQALISTEGSTSVLVNIIPVPAGAGIKVNVIFFPVCRPIPVALIAFFIVL